MVMRAAPCSTSQSSLKVSGVTMSGIFFSSRALMAGMALVSMVFRSRSSLRPMG